MPFFKLPVEYILPFFNKHTKVVLQKKILLAVIP